MFADLAGFDRDNVVYGRSYLAAIAVVYELLGVTPFTARLVSFASGLIAIAAIYGVGRELWDRRVGILAAAFFAVAPNVVRQSHDARPEMMLVAVWTVAFLLLLAGSRLGSRWRLIAAGILAALAADVHLNGAMVAPALLLALVVRRASWSTLGTYALGVGIGLATWLAVHVLGAPQRFLDQLQAFNRGVPIARVLSDPIFVLVSEVLRYLFVEPVGSVVLVLVTVVATLVLLVARRDRSLLTLLVVGGSFILFMAIFVGVKTPIYAVLLWPIAALLVARHVEIAPRSLAWATAGLVFLVSFGSLGWYVAQQWPSDYPGYIARLREHVPAGASVQAHASTWFGLMDHPFIASHYFLWAGPYEAEVRRLGIDYVIADGLKELGGCAGCRPTYAEEARAFLAEHAVLVGEVRDPFYGQVPDEAGSGYVSRIYRVLP